MTTHMSLVLDPSSAVAVSLKKCESITGETESKKNIHNISGSYFDFFVHKIEHLFLKAFTVKSSHNLKKNYSCVKLLITF